MLPSGASVQLDDRRATEAWDRPSPVAGPSRMANFRESQVASSITKGESPRPGGSARQAGPESLIASAHLLLRQPTPHCGDHRGQTRGLGRQGPPGADPPNSVLGRPRRGRALGISLTRRRNGPVCIKIRRQPGAELRSPVFAPENARCPAGLSGTFPGKDSDPEPPWPDQVSEIQFLEATEEEVVSVDFRQFRRAPRRSREAGVDPAFASSSSRPKVSSRWLDAPLLSSRARRTAKAWTEKCKKKDKKNSFTGQG